MTISVTNTKSPITVVDDKVTVKVSSGVGPQGPAGPAGGVASLNGATGALTLAAVGASWGVAGTTITLTVSPGVSAWGDLTGKPFTALGTGLSVVAGVLSATGLAIADTTGLQTALDAKAPLASPTFTGTVAGVTKAMVGLGSVDNTTDASKPVSTAQAAADAVVQAYAIQRANHTGTQSVDTITGLQTALDLKAPLASPTFTGTVAGVTKAMVGLGSVDNTTDASKPVSTAQAAADAVVQAYAIQRANHTGTQSVDTITGLGGAATLSVGTTGGTVAAGNDSRITEAISAATAATTYQPLDADLTSIAALTTTTFGRSFLAQADASATRTTIGLGTLATQSGTFSGASSGTNSGDQTASTISVANDYSSFFAVPATVEGALIAISGALENKADSSPATTSQLGPIIVGSGLGVASGTVSVTYGSTAATACQGNDARLSDSRAPNGAAGGDLTGSYPSPTIAAGAVTDAKIVGMAASKLSGTVANARLTTRINVAARLVMFTSFR